MFTADATTIFRFGHFLVKLLSNFLNYFSSFYNNESAWSMHRRNFPPLLRNSSKLVFYFLFWTSNLRLKKSTRVYSLLAFVNECFSIFVRLFYPSNVHFLTMTALSWRSITLTSLTCLNYIITIPPRNSFRYCMNWHASRSRWDFPTPGSPKRKVTGVFKLSIFLLNSNRSISLQIEDFLLNWISLTREWSDSHLNSPLLPKSVG